jgi:hypothetical protein
MYSRYARFLPEYAQHAFDEWYAYGAKDEVCEAFAGTWGGVSLEHFFRALEQGQGDDRLCAMFGLGASMVPEAIEALFPFLHSARRDERCVSAIVLGICEDARAYPFLEKVLLEGLSLEERVEAFVSQNQERMEEFWVCDRFRPTAVELLEEWDSPTLIQTLTQALQALRVLEKASPRFGIKGRVYGTLCYALGRRSIFTALETLDFPPAYYRIAKVYLALGALDVTPEPTSMRWVLNNESQMQRF